MKKAAIISIGDELLTGQTTDTNARFLTSQLISLGIPTAAIYTAPDEINAIIRALKIAAKHTKIIIITGGLGPTEDDLTRQAIAKFMKVKLKLNHLLLRKIEKYFDDRNKPMPENNKIQALLPEKAEPIPNNIGTAPGIMAKHQEKLLFALPGVPDEMELMFHNYLVPKLKKLVTKQNIVIKKLRCTGTGESNIAKILGELLKRPRNPQISTTAQKGVITLHITAAAENKKKAQTLARKDEKLVRKKLGDLVYGSDEQTLPEVVAQKLLENKKTIAVAESCTAGLLAKLLTDIPGSSNYFKCGWITYSDQTKRDMLGIPADIIEKYGAVSEPVAAAMAKVARKKAKTDIAIAITGIAGPQGRKTKKPVGLVYIAVDFQGIITNQKHIMSGNRSLIRLKAALTALNILRLRFND